MNTVDTLNRALAERLLILDGAMGTMVQRFKLSEQDFRGERFADRADRSRRSVCADGSVAGVAAADDGGRAAGGAAGLARPGA